MAQVNQPDQRDLEWVDISIPIREGMVQWPRDPPVIIELIMDMERGDSHNISQLSLGSHSGTHIDAPLHFLTNGAGIDEIPLDVITGKARIIEIRNAESINEDELALYNIKRGERILFKTHNSALMHSSSRFNENYVYLTEKAARYLADCRIGLIGIDYLSVGGFLQGGSEVHRILLKAGIWILESIDLSDVSPGVYELLCLPLRIVKGDGAPARAVLRKL